MSLPDVVSHEQWLRARTELLAREKQLTRMRDRLVADRRRLPMERVDKDYRFTGPDGELTLEDLFEFPGRSSFLRTDDGVFRTYSVFARGTETIGGSYYLLDETALGRQEQWEEPQGRVESARAATPDFGG